MQPTALASGEVYHPAAGTWRLTGPLVKGRSSHTATLLRDGRVLLAGGSFEKFGSTGLKDAELYDPTSRSWSATGSLQTPRYLHTATLLRSGEVLAAGGSTFAPEATDTAELFAPASGTWEAIEPLQDALYYHTATRLRDGSVLVAGGLRQIPFAVLTSAEVYQP